MCNVFSHERIYAPLQVQTLYGQIIRRGDTATEFVLVGPEQEMKFEADSQEERDLWIQAIRNAGAECLDEFEPVRKKERNMRVRASTRIFGQILMADESGKVDASFRHLRSLPKDFVLLNRQISSLLLCNNQLTEVCTIVLYCYVQCIDAELMQMPNELLELHRLSECDLSMNSITTLPVTAAKLSQLQTLSLAHNNIDVCSSSES